MAIARNQFVERLLSPEILDDPDLPDHVHREVHRDLRRINAWLGNTAAIISALRHDPIPVRRVLDIGCGSGEVLLAIRRVLRADVVGVDLRAPKDVSAPVPIIQANAIRSPLPASDVAISLCMAHHLSESELRELILNAGRSCRRFIVLDLVRHRLPLLLFRTAVAPFIGRVTFLDGVQSIRRSYTPRELSRLVANALRGTRARVRHSVAPLYIRQVVDISFGDGNTM